MTLLKVSFIDILRNDSVGHFDTFGEIFNFDTFKNDYLDHFNTFGEKFYLYTFKKYTLENDTSESVWADAHILKCTYIYIC